MGALMVSFFTGGKALERKVTVVFIGFPFGLG